jgi:uncharacterized protein (TIGR03382 family)
MKPPTLGATGFLAVCLLSSTAVHANTTGMTGRSGKQGMTCATHCHMVGTSTPAASVELTGPTSLAAGETGQYALIVRGGPASRAGMNVAVSNTAASLTAGTGQRKESGELTHTAPRAFSNGEARFDFSLVAPATGGNLKLFGAGNSVNGNGEMTGDAIATTTLDITVTGGTQPPDEDKQGGCSATGGASMLPWALLGLGVRRRHRD